MLEDSLRYQDSERADAALRTVAARAYVSGPAGAVHVVPVIVMSQN
jgi:hypothetical protein